MKAAGASGCASGKFFNLRRFTRSRFDERRKVGAGNSLSVRAQPSRISREADTARLGGLGFGQSLGGADSEHLGVDYRPVRRIIRGKAWIASSWRQYLAWFAGAEKRLTAPDAASLASSWLREAEIRRLQMEERASSGRSPSMRMDTSVASSIGRCPPPTETELASRMSKNVRIFAFWNDLEGGGGFGGAMGRIIKRL